MQTNAENTMKRIMLFIMTNVAIMVVLSITLRLLGVDSILAENGSDLNIQALVILSGVIGFGGSIISLLISKWMAKRMTSAVVITQAETKMEKWLINTVEKQARIVGIKMPEVAIFPDLSMNAFATGANKNNALMAVSQGLLNNMTQGEIEAVVGHEMSHIANGDMVTLALIQGVVNTFVVFLSRIVGHVVDRVILKNNQGHGIGYFVTVMISQVVLSVLASTIVMYFSRKREFVADTGGADLAGHQNMIAALKRLGQVDTEPLPEQMAAFGINNKGGFAAFFSSHPPIEARIKALELRAQQVNSRQ
jgi:heat shock protein HtpX